MLSRKWGSSRNKTGIIRKLPTKAFFSENLVQLINKETDFGSRVPLRFLATRKARQNFLKAIFDSRGAPHKTPHGGTPFVELSLKNKSVADAVSLYLQELGIEHTRPLLPQRGVSYNIRVALSGIPAFREKIGFRSKKKQAKLFFLRDQK